MRAVSTNQVADFLHSTYNNKQTQFTYQKETKQKGKYHL